MILVIDQRSHLCTCCLPLFYFSFNLRYISMLLLFPYKNFVYTGGVDVFAKAKTGTGKTLAFLIPGIDMLLKELHRHSKHVRAANRQRGVREDRIEKPLLLILSPTRSLFLSFFFFTCTSFDKCCRFYFRRDVKLILEVTTSF